MIAFLAWRFDTHVGWCYALAYAAALLPGVPIGLALFGRRHAAGWVAGALLGYALTASLLWLCLAAGVARPASLIAAWAVLAAASSGFCLVPRPLVVLPAWGRSDTLALLLVLLMVPVLVGPAFLRIGERDGAGNRLYRSYFTADFVWHMALTAELSQLRLPPRDPYAAPEPLHYYWTYFLPPALGTAALPSGLDHVSGILRINALGAGLLFIGILFIATWTAVPSAWAAAAGVAMALLAASAEGLYAVISLARNGVPLTELRNLNIDAISMWFLRGLTIDGLPRALWYTPQHAGACALGLIALTMASAAGTALPAMATLGAGLALGLALAFSPFLGGLFSLAFGVAMLLDALRAGRAAWPSLARQSLAAMPVLVAAGLCVAAGVLEGAGGALRIGPTSRPGIALATLAVALGPLLLVAAPGVWHVARRGPALLPSVAGAILGLAVFNFVSLGGTDPFWVGWRAGNLLLVTLPALAAATCVAVGQIERASMRRVLVTALGLVAACGLPTTLVDAYNAQDTANRGRAPGYSWTLVVSPDQQAGYDWIRTWTGRRTIVQMEPTTRGREGWTAIPAFAQRAMAAGLPISLVNLPYHRERSNQVRRLYETVEGDAAWRLARALHIDFLYVDRLDRAAFPEAALRKFDEAPAQFQPVFREGQTAIYAVLP